MATSRDELINICQQAMQVLRDEFNCKQIDVWKKLADYDVFIGKTTASKVLNGNGRSVEALAQITKGVQKLVEDALCMEWVNDQFEFTAKEAKAVLQPQRQTD